MNLPGLHHQIAMKRMAAAELARQARQEGLDPRTAHEMSTEAQRVDAEADELSKHLRGNQECQEGILHQINYLAQSPHKSRHRSLAITELENAYARLQLENGAPEPERKFEVVHPFVVQG